MGSGGNFRTTLEIVSGRVTPRGPLDLDPEDTIEKIWAWVVQLYGADEGVAVAGWEAGGAIVTTNRVGDPEWAVSANLDQQGGNFRTGLAVGVALAVITVTDDEGVSRTTVRWWSETIRLVDETAA